MLENAKQREEQFRKELNELLVRHGAELVVDAKEDKWGQSTPYIEVRMVAVWNGCKLLKDFTEFEL